MHQSAKCQPNVRQFALFSRCQFPMVEESWNARMNCFITEQNNIIICYFDLPDQTKKLLCPGSRWADGQPIFFLFDSLTFFFPSLQSLKQNLQDEVMHNGVKWELFTSLTRRERLRAQTTDSFWTIKLGLSIFGISRKTQCGAQSRRERDFKRLLCRRPQACSFGNKAVTCHFPYPLRQTIVKLLRSSTFLEGTFDVKYKIEKKKLKKVGPIIKLYVSPLRQISLRARGQSRGQQILTPSNSAIRLGIVTETKGETSW